MVMVMFTQIHSDIREPISVCPVKLFYYVLTILLLNDNIHQ